MRPIVVLYDGWCPFCIKSIKSFKRFDLFNRIDFLSFRDKENFEKYNLNIKVLEKRIHSIKTSSNKVEDGINCINRMCKNTPVLWVFVPFLSILSYMGLGQKSYDWVASRRTIFPTGGCDDLTCEIPTNKSEI